MRKFTALFLLFAATGCIPNYATVDEACDDKLPGSKNIDNQVAKDVFQRINCYRRVTKLSRASMDTRVQEAVENHSDYLKQNFVVEHWPEKIHTEESGKPGYTGDDAYDRLEATDYPNVSTGSLGLWQYIYWDDEDAVDRIDFWFHDPGARESFLALAWVAGGYAETSLDNITEESGGSPNMAYMNIFYQVPVRDHAGTPAIYPRDGQEDIPTGFEGADPNGIMFGKGVIGYPITAAVGSLESGGGQNAHGIKVGKSTLTGPSGEIDMEIYTPDTDGRMRYQAAWYPLEELEPNSEYTLEFELTWGDYDSRPFQTTFKTGKASIPHGRNVVPTGRGVPQAPEIRHTILKR